MKKNYVTILLINVLIYVLPLRSQTLDNLDYVKTFADNSLKHGTDVYGTVHTPMWASVIDVITFTVPVRSVPPTKGTRPHDRAVGGSNYYHDVVTLKVFDCLSEITNEKKYRIAADDYTKSFLKRTQNPYTGLLGWGEHLYYNFYIDTVTISENKILDPKEYFIVPHELIAWTPPWERLWKANEERTQQAIIGLKYHYNGPDPKVYLFNRHAIWNKAQYQEEIMPWIKHSALISYSFAYLYKKTKESQWQNWSRDAGMLYWNLRDRNTNLVFDCYYHSRSKKAGKLSSIGGTAKYAYWLYKASQVNNIAEMKKASLELIKAYDKYGWDPKKRKYYNNINLDGTVPENAKTATAWKIGYGGSSVLMLGRTSIYMYQFEKLEYLKEIAIKAAGIVNSSILPDNYTAQNIGEAINLNMDIYTVTGNNEYLDIAKNFANIAKLELWKNNFFIRQKADHYYEGKLGVGDLLAGLIRIHIAENNLETSVDWSH